MPRIWLREGPVLLDSNLVRVGKKAVVVSAGGPLLAGRGVVTFVRLPRSAATGADDYTPERWVGRVRERAVEQVDGSIYSRLGMREIDAGGSGLELDLTSFVVNLIGTIQGGAHALLVGAAAHAMRPGLVATDTQVHFLSQVRTVPARSDDDRLSTLTTLTLPDPPRDGHDKCADRAGESGARDVVDGVTRSAILRLGTASFGPCASTLFRCRQGSRNRWYAADLHRWLMASGAPC